MRPMIQVTPNRSVSMPYRGANGAGPRGMRIALAPSDKASQPARISFSSSPWSDVERVLAGVEALGGLNVVGHDVEPVRGGDPSEGDLVVL